MKNIKKVVLVLGLVASHKMCNMDKMNSFFSKLRDSYKNSDFSGTTSDFANEQSFSSLKKDNDARKEEYALKYGYPYMGRDTINNEGLKAILTIKNDEQLYDFLESLASEDVLNKLTKSDVKINDAIGDKYAEHLMNAADRHKEMIIELNKYIAWSNTLDDVKFSQKIKDNLVSALYNFADLIKELNMQKVYYPNGSHLDYNRYASSDYGKKHLKNDLFSMDWTQLLGHPNEKVKKYVNSMLEKYVFHNKLFKKHFDNAEQDLIKRAMVGLSSIKNDKDLINFLNNKEIVGYMIKDLHNHKNESLFMLLFGIQSNILKKMPELSTSDRDARVDDVNAFLRLLDRQSDVKDNEGKAEKKERINNEKSLYKDSVNRTVEDDLKIVEKSFLSKTQLGKNMIRQLKKYYLI